MNIEIEYDGKWPNLCSGKLVVTIDGTVWDFKSFCLCSGGEVTSDKDWNFTVTQGMWTIYEWPEGFPEELKLAVLEEINNTIDHGCCGGCI